MKKNMTDVATIMCVYKDDDAQLFNSSLNSLLVQTIPSDIFVFVDGFVNDDIKKIISKYEHLITFYHSDVNKGLAFGLNFLIDNFVLGKYRFAMRADADDISLKSRTAVLYTFLVNNPNISVVGSYAREYGSSISKKLITVPTEHNALVIYSVTRCPFIHPSVMFSLDRLGTDLVYPTCTELSEDLALWHILLKNNHFFANVPKRLILYHIDDNTLNRRNGLKKAFSELKLRLSFSFSQNIFSPFVYTLLFLRFLLKLSPSWFSRIIYKNFR